MAKQRQRWDFYHMGWENGPTYDLLRSTSQHWPVKVFQQIADQRGYNRLERDQTLVGGYFVNSSTGDCLVCVPHGMNPDF